MKKRVKTQTISENSVRQQHLRYGDYDSGGDSSVDQQKQIRLVIRGITEELMVSSDRPVYIGKFHLTNPVALGLDLSPHGAEQYGVSRLHASLEVTPNNYVYITDLDSTNGTLLAGEHLFPFIRTQVYDGDEIVMGNLLMKIRFTSNENRAL